MALSKKIRVLVVARNPLGGIRSYMNYTYKYIDKKRFKFTVLASPTIENEALIENAKDNGIELLIRGSSKNADTLWIEIFKLLYRRRFDVIQSHGLISAANVYLGNFIQRAPHIMTLHGIVEQRLIGHGIKAFLKNYLLSRVASSADVIYGVSRDILEHFEDVINVNDNPKRVIIHNGIDLEKFSTDGSGYNKSLIDKLDISKPTTLFGFLGRFMPQKGFNFIIDAMEILEEEIPDNEIVILAVGSGDYLDYYRKQISNKNLKHKFKFLPFQKNIGEVYKVLDAVLMPSIWEAYPLLVAESLCSGIPLIVSDCIGMREASKNTPAIVVKTGDPVALSKAMNHVYTNRPKGAFMGYAPIARKKFDVIITSKYLEDLFVNTLQNRKL